jgi:hypothetical protein
MKKKSINLLGLVLLTMGTQSVATECKIITSPFDSSTMTFGYSNWNAQTIPIITSSDFKYTSFVDAYKEFDSSLRSYLKETVCKKNKWDGVANYKIQWQQTEKTYNFTASYDTFSNK